MATIPRRSNCLRRAHSGASFVGSAHCKNQGLMTSDGIPDRPGSCDAQSGYAIRFGPSKLCRHFPNIRLMALVRAKNGTIGTRLAPKFSSAWWTARRRFTTRASSGCPSWRCFRRSTIASNAASSSSVHSLRVPGLDFEGATVLRPVGQGFTCRVNDWQGSAANE